MTELGKQIIELKEDGKTYTEIKNELGCSKGTISYYCGDGQRSKTKFRNNENRETTKYKIYKKIDNYMAGETDGFYESRTDDNHILYKKIISNPYCYITGKKIDLSDNESWSIDHIIPISKGGKSTIENAGLCLSIINRMKTDLLVEEFKEYCELVLDNIE